MSTNTEIHNFLTDSGCQSGHFCPVDIGEINYTGGKPLVNLLESQKTLCKRVRKWTFSVCRECREKFLQFSFKRHCKLPNKVRGHMRYSNRQKALIHPVPSQINFRSITTSFGFSVLSKVRGKYSSYFSFKTHFIFPKGVGSKNSHYSRPA